MIGTLAATLLFATPGVDRVLPAGGLELGVGYTPSAPVEAPISLIGGASILFTEHFGLELLARATFAGRRSIALEPLASAEFAFRSGVVATIGGGASFGTDRYLTVGPTFLASVGWWPLRLVATVRFLDALPLVSLSARVDLVMLFTGLRGMLTGYR